MNKNIEHFIENQTQIQIQKISWDEIFGLTNQKTKIRETISYLKRITSSIETEKPPLSFLLFGPPGCGKTTIISAISNEQDHPYLLAVNPYLFYMSKYEPKDLLHAIFELSKKNAPSILFFDELHHLAPNNKDISNLNLINELIQELNDIKIKNDLLVLIIAETNKPWEIKEEFVHYFEEKLYISLLDKNLRKEMLENLIQNFKTEKKLNIDKIVEITEGYSGADIHTFFREAAMHPIRELISLGTKKINENDLRPMNVNDFLQASQLIKPTITKENEIKYEQWIKHFK